MRVASHLPIAPVTLIAQVIAKSGGTCRFFFIRNPYYFFLLPMFLLTIKSYVSKCTALNRKSVTRSQEERVRYAVDSVDDKLLSRHDSCDSQHMKLSNIMPDFVSTKDIECMLGIGGHGPPLFITSQEMRHLQNRGSRDDRYRE